MPQSNTILEIGMIYTLHELKNPLTSIILTLEQLEAGGVENPEVFYAMMKKNALQISKSIHELCACYEEEPGHAHQLPPALETKLGDLDEGI